MCKIVSVWKRDETDKVVKCFNYFTSACLHYILLIFLSSMRHIVFLYCFHFSILLPCVSSPITSHQYSIPINVFFLSLIIKRQITIRCLDTHEYSGRRVVDNFSSITVRLLHFYSIGELAWCFPKFMSIFYIKDIPLFLIYSGITIY